MKKKICWVRVFKNLSYFLIPVLCVVLLVCIVSLMYNSDSIRKEQPYFESANFANYYVDSIENAFENSVNTSSCLEEYEEGGNENGLVFGYASYHLIKDDVSGVEMPIYYLRFQSNFNYLIVDNENKIAYTNLEDSIDNNTIEAIREHILSNRLYWQCENGSIDTTIKKLDGNINDNTEFYRTYQLKDGRYEVYTSILDDLPNYDQYFSHYWVYSIIVTLRGIAIYLIPAIILLLGIMFFIILLGIGRTSREEGIHLNFLDEWSLEIVILLSIPSYIFSFILCLIGFYNGIIGSLIFGCSGLLIFYVTSIVLLETVVKRLKTHTLIETTLMYWLYKQIKDLMENTRVSLRVSILFIGFIILNWLIFAVARKSILGVLLLMILYIWTFASIIRLFVSLKNIKNALNEIYKGNTNIHLDVVKYKGDLKEVAIYVNEIAGGLSNALSEQLKSERLKTELITNVSHDIKTPLTSIINYVDLLRKEGITNEKAEEYLAILDNKSQRLKRLTEDLVEASKASSGNIKLNKEKLEVNELIKQVSGEFEDRFKGRGLEEFAKFSSEQVYIYADSRYMYRILENVYSNVAKYALENTRVYTDIINNENSVVIQIKNISKEKLNISADELLQRFVRGDTSRNTEGSGLGLSIATSLTELQGGKFKIYLDGDLFKITIEFDKMESK